MPVPTIDLSFPHNWDVDVLATRPLILPQRHFAYPREVDEVERGALELLVRRRLPDPAELQPFLSTCALGFRDAAVANGVWSCPNPEEICAVAGGYAYLIDTKKPERFTMLPYRPVLQVRVVSAQGLLLFVGHSGILAWGAQGQAWVSDKLSDEGVTIVKIEGSVLRGMGWEMRTDQEEAFSLDLASGALILG